MSGTVPGSGAAKLNTGTVSVLKGEGYAVNDIVITLRGDRGSLGLMG